MARFENMLIALGAFSVSVVGKLVWVVPLIIPVKSSLGVFIQNNICFYSITSYGVMVNSWSYTQKIGLLVTLIINNAFLYAEQQPMFGFSGVYLQPSFEYC